MKLKGLLFIAILVFHGCQNRTINWRENQELCGVTYVDMWDDYLGTNAIYIKEFNPQSMNDLRRLPCFSHCFLLLKEQEKGHPVENKISIYPREFATTEEVRITDFPIVIIHLSPSPYYEVQNIVIMKKGRRLKTYDAKMIKDSLVCHCPTLAEKRNQLFCKHIKSLSFSGRVSNFSTEYVDSGFVNVVIDAKDISVIRGDYFYHPLGPKGFSNCAGLDERVCYNSNKIVINFSKKFVDENLNIGSLLYSDLDDSRIFFKKEKLFAEPYNSLQDFEEQYVPSACQ